MKQYKTSPLAAAAGAVLLTLSISAVTLSGAAAEGASAPATTVAAATHDAPPATPADTVVERLETAKALLPELSAPGLDPKVLELALDAAACAKRERVAKRPELLTVIDYSLPSTERRMWVFDLENRELLYNELVAHGKNTGARDATAFSNVMESKQTSLGLFTTDETYYGSNGYSLRLDGHDRGYNDRARDRAIVMHGAPYVSEDFIARHGRIGRSWGCPALDQGIAREVIDTIKGGSLVFAYYPDDGWLGSSKFLGCGGDAGTTLAP